METVVTLGASHAEIPLVRAVKQLGFRCVVVSGDATGMAIAVADEFVECDYSDVAAVSAVVAIRRPAAVIAGCNDFAAITASEIAVQFGLPGHDLPAITRAVHLKSEFRLLCDELALSNPRAVAFDDPIAASSHCTGSPLPLIVKPVDLTGGKGIGLIRTAEDIAPVVESAFRASREKVVVIEEFVEGTLHSCCAMVVGHRVVFDFFADESMLENPFLVSAATSPSVIAQPARTDLIDEIEMIARRLDLVDGLVHVQFIMDGDRPRIIEVCRRPPGDLYLELVRRSVGFDIADAIVRNALGRPFSVVSESVTPVLRQCVMVEHAGQVTDVRFDDVLGPHVVMRVPLRQLPTSIVNHLTEKTEIFFAEFDSADEMRTTSNDIRRHLEITFS
jgi:biotin carboxylase